MQRLAPQADSPRVPVSHHARRAARGPERAMRDYPRPSPCQGVADVVRGPLSGVWGCVGARAPPPGDRAAMRLAAPPDAKCSVHTHTHYDTSSYIIRFYLPYTALFTAIHTLDIGPNLGLWE